MTNEQQEQFLEELSELTRKHGIVIAGCGCCGSPSLSDLEEKMKGGYYFTYGLESDLTWSREPK